MKMKWLAPLLAYAAVTAGMFFLQSAWAALLAFHSVLVLSLLVAKPNIPFSLLFKSNSKKWIGLNILLCGSSGIGVYFLRPYFGVAGDFSIQLESIGLTTSTWPLFIAYFSLVNPFIEEYFWRGYLGSSSRGLHIGDALYAGYHVFLLSGKVQLPSIIFAFVMLAAAGWFWRQVARDDQGLFASVAGHMAADFSILTVVYWMSSL